MIRTKLSKLHLSPISLHSASSVHIHSSVNNFRDMLPTIRLSPLGSPIIRKYTTPFNAFKRRGMYPYVSKCNAKRCVCCTHLCTKTTITSSVNGRQFSIINYKNIKRHETELKWIKFLQSPFPLGFDDNKYHEGNISKLADFFSVLECKRRKSRSHGKRENGNIMRKICTEKRLNTSLKDLSLALTNHGRHVLFSFF